MHLFLKGETSSPFCFVACSLFFTAHSGASILEVGESHLWMSTTVRFMGMCLVFYQRQETPECVITSFYFFSF